MNTTIVKNDVRNLLLNQKRLEKEVSELRRIVAVAISDELSPITLRKAEMTSRLLDKGSGKRFGSIPAFNKYLKNL